MSEYVSPSKGILLGFEVGTGKPVYLPFHHFGFTGMTGKAGKTTAIEAIGFRSGYRTINFITKRGEKAFIDTKEIPLFFKERSDWRYVESLIEAELTEDQRYNRAWIIKVCRGTKGKLRKVWENVKEAKQKARKDSLSERVYTCLDAYFEIIIPELEKYKFSSNLEIGKDPNNYAMNLIGMAEATQAVIIRSVLEEIYEHEHEIIATIPEAWKFIGTTNTPVTEVAVHIIKEGFAVKIFLCVDSQDIASINPKIRGQIDNWILGRQRYEHEIERTLKAIPVKEKPTKEEIQTLKLGHFYVACEDWLKHVYALPVGVPEEVGRQVAKGELEPEYVRDRFLKSSRVQEEDEEMYKEKYLEEKKKRKKLEETLKSVQKQSTKQITELREENKKQNQTIQDLKDAQKDLLAFRDLLVAPVIRSVRKEIPKVVQEEVAKTIPNIQKIEKTASVKKEIDTAELIPVVDKRLRQLIGAKKEIEVVTVDMPSKMRELVKNEATKPIITAFQGLTGNLKKATRFMFQMKEASVGQLNEHLYQRSGRPAGAFYNNIVKPLQKIGIISLQDGTLTWTLKTLLTSRLPFLKADETQKLHDYLVSLVLSEEA